MKRIETFVFALLAFWPIGVLNASTEAVVNHPEFQTALRVLDTWVEEEVRQREQPGLSIGVVYDQNLVWTKGYGFADLEKEIPASSETLYRIASNSKLFTATAVMQLRDAGKLDLDDPVSKHLPWFKIQRTDLQGGPVKIRHLLTHTSGLPREVANVHWVDLNFPTREEMIRNLPNQTSPLPINSQWKYSNLALSLAGEIVAAVSGEPWETYVERNILTPLGMMRTRTVPTQDQPGMAIGYSRRVPGQDREVRPYVDVAAERPAGSIASCVDDLAKFVSLQFQTDTAHESQVLSASSLGEMHRVQWLLPDWKTAWGLGFRIERVDGDVRIGHGGSLPGFRTDISFSPTRKLGIIVLTNAGDGQPTSYRDQAFKLLGPAIDMAHASARKPQTVNPDFAKYAGTFTNPWSDVQVLVVESGLVLVDPNSSELWESRIVLKQEEDGVFLAVPNQWDYLLTEERFRFETDTEGRVTRLVGTFIYWDRSK